MVAGVEHEIFLLFEIHDPEKAHHFPDEQYRETIKGNFKTTRIFGEYYFRKHKQFIKDTYCSWRSID